MVGDEDKQRKINQQMKRGFAKNILAAKISKAWKVIHDTRTRRRRYYLTYIKVLLIKGQWRPFYYQLILCLKL